MGAWQGAHAGLVLWGSRCSKSLHDLTEFGVQWGLQALRNGFRGDCGWGPHGLWVPLGVGAGWGLQGWRKAPRVWLLWVSV